MRINSKSEDEFFVIQKSFRHFWESDTSGEFTVGEDPRGNTLPRGTSIVLHLSEHAMEFAEEETLRNLVRKYSMFINFPIHLWTSEEVEKEVALSDTEIAEARAKLVKEREEENSQLGRNRN
jgi:heat shock protein beta